MHVRIDDGSVENICHACKQAFVSSNRTVRFVMNILNEDAGARVGARRVGATVPRRRRTRHRLPRAAQPRRRGAHRLALLLFELTDSKLGASSANGNQNMLHCIKCFVQNFVIFKLGENLNR